MNDFERMSKWTTLISFWTSKGRLFIPGRSMLTGKGLMDVVDSI